MVPSNEIVPSNETVSIVPSNKTVSSNEIVSILLFRKVKCNFRLLCTCLHLFTT